MSAIFVILPGSLTLYSARLSITISKAILNSPAFNRLSAFAIILFTNSLRELSIIFSKNFLVKETASSRNKYARSNSNGAIFSLNFQPLEVASLIHLSIIEGVIFWIGDNYIQIDNILTEPTVFAHLQYVVLVSSSPHHAFHYGLDVFLFSI